MEAQGGDAGAIADPSRLPAARATLDVAAPADGVVEAIDTEAIGLAAVALGAGRARVDEPVDHAVGLMVHRKLGDRVRAGEPLCTLHLGERGREPPEATAARVVRAYRLGQTAPPPPRSSSPGSRPRPRPEAPPWRSRLPVHPGKAGIPSPPEGDRGH